MGVVVRKVKEAKRRKRSEVWFRRPMGALLRLQVHRNILCATPKCNAFRTPTPTATILKEKAKAHDCKIERPPRHQARSTYQTGHCE